MADELKHAFVGNDLDQAEWQAVDTHIADGQTANDMLYFNGTYWIRATPAQIKAILSLNNVENTVHSTDAHTMTIDGIDVSAHDIATTDVHGVGAGTVAKTADITATKLDDLTAPDDNTDLNASTSRHGLLLKLNNVATDFLNGQGGWSAPAGGTSIPSGLIAMWHGLIANIPSGWLICDGNNSTPNLLARFVEGVATAATDPGTTGGAVSKTTSTGDTTGSGSSGTYTSKATHVHTISDIRPPFYDIAFLMKT